MTKYSTAIQLANKIEEDKHDNIYWHIICCILVNANLYKER